MRRALVIGMVGAAIAAWYLWREDRGIILYPNQHPYVHLYEHSHGWLEAAMTVGDGQAYGALARDPTLARPHVMKGGPADVAYRYQRPLLGYLSWAGSLGRPQWEPGAQAAVVVAGAGIAVGALAELLRRRALPPALAVLAVFTPGMRAAISGLTAETLGIAFLLLGLLAYERRAACGQLAVWLSLAALTRETLLVVPAALIGAELWRSRGGAGEQLDRRLVRALLAPFAVYGSWLLVMRARLGAWPVAQRAARLSVVPLGGLFQQVAHLSHPRESFAWLVLAIGLVLYAAVRARRDPLTPIVLGYGVLALFLGHTVWQQWQDFTRPLAPLFVVGLVVLASGARSSVCAPISTRA